MTDLTPTLRTALTKALDPDLGSDLTDAERDALTTLRDTCPTPPRQPDRDGIWERRDRGGDWQTRYVSGGRAYPYRRDDGTAWGMGPSLLTTPWATEAEWRPVVSIPEPTDEQAREICRALLDGGVAVDPPGLRHILDECREVMGR